MTLTDRLEWLLLGFVLGFIVGYSARAIKDLHASHWRKPEPEDKDEQGFMRYPIVQDMAVIVVLALTVFAAYSAAMTNEKLKQTVSCNRVYLQKNLAADTSRSNYLRLRLEANAELQQNQFDFLGSLSAKPPKSEEERKQAFQNYLQSLQSFIEISKQENKLADYPTVEELQVCLDK